MSVKASDSAPWSGRPTSDFCLSARECANLPHTALSRLEARLQLEAALEARNPRLLHKKPTAAGAPIDLYALHQVVLRLGGYRKVRAPRVSARQEEPGKGLAKRGKGAQFSSLRGLAPPRRRARAAPRTPLCALPLLFRQVESEALWDKAVEAGGLADGQQPWVVRNAVRENGGRGSRRRRGAARFGLAGRQAPTRLAGARGAGGSGAGGGGDPRPHPSGARAARDASPRSPPAPPAAPGPSSPPRAVPRKGAAADDLD